MRRRRSRLEAVLAIGLLLSMAAPPATASAATTYPSTVLADSPVSYWRLGERTGTTAADGAGTNNGSIKSGVTLGVAGALPADTDTAMAFNGSSGYIGVADSPSLDFTGAFTLEAWARPNVLSGVDGAIVHKGTTNSSSTWQYRLSITSGNKWRGSVYVGKSTITVTAPGTPSTTSWTHLVMTRSSGTLILYVNGAAVATTNFTGAVNTSTGQLAIGRAGSKSTSYFNGRIDEVAVYGTALSASQVSAHYQAGIVLPPPPVASFTASPTSGVAPMTVAFTDASTGSPTAWSWDFGDGTTSTAQNPSHAYSAAGTYTATLTASNAGGSSQAQQAITVAAPPPPVASFTASPTSGVAPMTVAFTDTSTGSPTAWSWDFGDGTTATAQNPSHIYSAAGTYSVSLTATNAGGPNTATQPNLITVATAQTPPTASFSASPTSGAAPLTVAFTDTSTGSPTAWSWDFGDGMTSTAQNPSHTYSAVGTYTATLTAGNTAGSTSAQQSIGVSSPPPPAASFTASPTSGTAPLLVTFTDTSTGGPTAWSWDFGDGTTSTAQSPSHGYGSGGAFTVTLTASNAGGPSTASQTITVTANTGYQGPSYSGVANPPTSDKPQSKLWWNDGSWWADMFDSGTHTWRIYRLDRPTETWVNTGTLIDGRTNTLADVLWDGTHLYVASHVVDVSTDASPVASTSGNPARLYRFSYAPATKTYSLDNGFPATITDWSSESMTIDKDSTGVLWATWTQVSGSGGSATNAVYVNSTNGNDATWGTPFVLPVSGATPAPDDISAIVAYGGNKIGVMWSNQADQSMYWAVHVDGTAVGQWRGSTALHGNSQADDHLNLKALQSDPAGRVFAAVKTSADDAGLGPNAALIDLLVFKPATGNWDVYTYGTVADCHTRPLVLLDSEHGVVHVYATAPASSGCPYTGYPGSIYEKSAPMSNPVFPTGRGTPVIADPANPSLNNPTSTKQGVSSATGIVVLASNDATSRYWHLDESLGGGTPPPPPVASFTASPTTGTAPLDVAFTDTSTGGPTSWSWDFGDGGSSSAQNPSHTYAAAGTYTVTLIASNAGGSSTSTRASLISVATAPTAPTASFTATPTVGTVPLAVSFIDTSTGGPTAWSWDFGDGTTSTLQSPSHTYQSAGSYTVSLTASNAQGPNTLTKSAYIAVNPPGSSTYEPAVLADGPVAYWRLGELTGSSAADTAGTYPGTYTGTITRGVTGAIVNDANAAIGLNGTNGYVAVNDAAALDFAGDFTVEAWARPNALSGVGGAVVHKGGSSGYTVWQYRLSITSANKWRGTVFVGNSAVSVTAPATPSTSAWTHLVMTKAGSTLTLYVNGVAVATASIGGTVNASTGILAIGRTGASSSDYFNGAIDEVAVYPTALSAARVAAHYQAGIGS